MPKAGKSKVTSLKVASKASAALRDGRSSPRTRSIAASALAQTGRRRGRDEAQVDRRHHRWWRSA